MLRDAQVLRDCHEYHHCFADEHFIPVELRHCNFTRQYSTQSARLTSTALDWAIFYCVVRFTPLVHLYSLCSSEVHSNFIPILTSDPMATP